MQTPICEVCLKSNILCSGCQEKLNSGKISQKDVELSRYLYALSEKMRSIRDIKILKVVDCGSLIIITGIGDAARLVGRGGVVVKKIAKDFKKSIRILEEATSFKDFVENLLSPAPISGINTLYKEDKEVYRVKIPSIQRNSVLINPEIFSQIISNFYNLKAEIVFEN
jgi:transcription antitermination factor NusA-like protein